MQQDSTIYYIDELASMLAFEILNENMLNEKDKSLIEELIVELYFQYQYERQ